ncbi:MAG: hypothetical protein C7B46_09400 [Sulfobacillus benefaciens]|uniref:Solute-binding protein family 5 domain-containing protein n=1 Tax=Sulfobacillus benefaciens TaxID=453960 RepID=A0A2T2XG67_9FIRM|nr:MAG: hypothetical protein C7B46_09400 [Sulfobacillus benefaciens]
MQRYCPVTGKLWRGIAVCRWYNGVMKIRPTLPKLGALTAAVFLAGCGAPHITLPRRGDILRRPTLNIVAQGSSTLNPVGSYDNTPAAAIDQLMWNGLVNIAPNGTIIPDLAMHWTIANHYQEFVVALDPRAKWWNGRPITAHDVVWTYQFYQNRYSGFHGYRALDRLIRSVSAVSPTQVAFRLNHPDPGFLADWASQGSNVFILPAFALDHLPTSQVIKAKALSEPLDFIGTGAFRPISLSSRYLALRAVPRYFEGTPKISYIFWRTSPPRHVTKLSAVLWLTPPTSKIPGLEPLWSEDGHYWILLANMHDGILRNYQALRGLYQGLDRAAVARLGDGQIANGPLPPSNWFANPLLEPPAFSPRSATIATASFKHQVMPILVDSDRPREVLACRNIAHQGQSLGIAFRCNPQPQRAFYSDLQHGRFVWAFVNRAASPVGWVFSQYYGGLTPPLGQNLGSYSNPDTNRALLATMITTENTQHMIALYQLQEALVKYPPGIFLAWPQRAVWVSSNFTGYQPNPYVAFFQPQSWYLILPKAVKKAGG